MTTNNRLPALAVLGFLAFAPTLSASIAELATFDEKVENAATILLGTCVRTESRWDAEHRWIVTYSTFRVEKVMKGSPVLGEVTIVTPGGSADGLHQDTIGVPTFHKGDERVLFVKITKSGPTVLYFDQGTYDVRTEGGERMVAPVATKLVKVDTKNGAAVVEDEAPRPLARFESDVRQTLRSIDERRQKMDTFAAERKARKADEMSLAGLLKRNSLLVGLALAGLALATWHLMRR